MTEEYCKDLCAEVRAGRIDPVSAATVALYRMVQWWDTCACALVRVGYKCLPAWRCQVVGRDREVSRVIQILGRRTKNNPILLGEPGVGKTAVVEGIAAAIVALQNGSAAGRMLDGTPLPSFLASKRILQLDVGLLIAGAAWSRGYGRGERASSARVYTQSCRLRCGHPVRRRQGARRAGGARDETDCRGQGGGQHHPHVRLSCTDCSLWQATDAASIEVAASPLRRVVRASLTCTRHTLVAVRQDRRDPHAGGRRLRGPRRRRRAGHCQPGQARAGPRRVPGAQRKGREEGRGPAYVRPLRCGCVRAGLGPYLPGALRSCPRSSARPRWTSTASTLSATRRWSGGCSPSRWTSPAPRPRWPSCR
jgi:hypothetical protein